MHQVAIVAEAAAAILRSAPYAGPERARPTAR